MAVSAVTSAATSSAPALQGQAVASVPDNAAKFILSQTSTTTMEGMVTITITYSDGTTATEIEPGDSIFLSAEAFGASDASSAQQS